MGDGGGADTHHPIPTTYHRERSEQPLRAERVTTVSVANHHPSPSSREHRGRGAFWIDDRIIDQYGPLLEQFPFGADALAVYAVLARRASRDGESWERVKTM